MNGYGAGQFRESLGPNFPAPAPFLKVVTVAVGEIYPGVQLLRIARAFGNLAIGLSRVSKVRISGADCHCETAEPSTKARRLIACRNEGVLGLPARLQSRESNPQIPPGRVILGKPHDAIEIRP
jgi:hypothetical protein